MKRLEHFKSHADFSIRDKDYMEFDKSIPKSFDALKPLEKVSIHNRLPIAEYLITYLHESQLPYHKYIAMNKLLNAFRDKYNLKPANKNKNKIYDTLYNYIYDYTQLIGHKVPSNTEQDTFTPSNDKFQLVLPYIMGINQTMRRFSLNISNRHRTPAQLDTFFIGPNHVSKLKLDSLPLDAVIYATSDAKSRNQDNEEKKMDPIDHIKSLLSDALIHAQAGDRYVMIIIRKNINNLQNDITYIYKYNQSLPPYFITDYSELIFLSHSKQIQKIIQNIFQCTDNNNMLGLHYHLHSYDINKTYISYGPFKQRIITQEQMLSKLMILFNNSNISDTLRDEFMINYRSLRDTKYKYGKYWFGIEFNEENDFKQPTEPPVDELSHMTHNQQHDELLIRFVAFEPTNMPNDIISQVPTNKPTVINFHDASFTELGTYDLEISQVNMDDQKYDNDNDNDEIKESKPADVIDTDSDSDNNNNNEYDAELQRMIRLINEMNNEIHNLENEALNINDMNEIDNAIEETENMEENVNEIYNNVNALNDNA